MAEVPENILSLPNDPFLHILSFLNYNDLVNCCKVCKRLQELSHSEILWKPLCQQYWCVRNCSERMTWYDIFKLWFNDYGKYIDIYMSIRKAWDQIEDYLEDNFYDVFESLQDGLSEEELDSIESTIHHKLPVDVRCAYRLHNGQKNNMVCSGLFGSLQVYNSYTSINLLDLKFAAKLCADFYRLNSRWKIGLALNGSYQTNNTRFLALSDENGHIPGQIFQPVTDLTKLNWVNADTEEHSLEDDFILANSFLEYFTKFAQNLEDGLYCTVNNKMYMLIKDPKCVERTGHIEVSAATCFCPEQSNINPPEFLHAYQITFTMDEDAPEEESCQLETRHWIITDEDGQEHKVEGPGVVGEYPTMRPGSTFSWISCSSFKTTYGNMTGYFTMRNLHSGFQVQIKCPTFHMKRSPYQTSNDRRLRLEQKKKLQ